MSFVYKLVLLYFAPLSLISSEDVNWDEFRDNIPLVAYAGASDHGGSWPIEELVDATLFGAIADDRLDDTDALQSALDEAARIASGKSGNVVVSLPEGTLNVDRMLFLDHSRVGIVGQSSDRTKIHFSRHLLDVLPAGKRVVEAAKQWSYRGGVLWIQQDGTRISSLAGSYEPAMLLADVDEGETFLPISKVDSDKFSTGQWINLIYLADKEWLRTVYGDEETFEQVPWERWPIISEDGRLRWEWSAKIVEVHPGGITLDRPLRTPARTGWNVHVVHDPTTIESVIVKGISFSFPEHEAQRHLNEHGFNALFLAGGRDCLIEDVAIHNADNGIFLERSCGNTLRNVMITGSSRMHHGISLRTMSHDNLVERFTLTPVSVWHGMSVQDLSSGNVWRSGNMETGTFDSHRGMPFDNVRTDIDIVGSGRPGGAFGPYVGRRMVHWNIRVSRPDHIKSGDPKEDHHIQRWLKRTLPLRAAQWFVRGALVGIQGVPSDAEAKPWALPPGVKGTIEKAWGVVPNPPDLFEHQKRSRNVKSDNRP